LQFCGSGVDYIYPKENEEIYKKIIKSGGTIVSEYPEGVIPETENFRQRNRIVSGLSLGVLIIEARQVRSGTSITAKYAREQKRDIFCIPNSIENKKGIRNQYINTKRCKISNRTKRNNREVYRKQNKTNNNRRHRKHTKTRKSCSARNKKRI